MVQPLLMNTTVVQADVDVAPQDAKGDEVDVVLPFLVTPHVAVVLKDVEGNDVDIVIVWPCLVDTAK